MATTIYCGNFDFVALAGTNWWGVGMGGGSQPAQAGRPSLIHAAGVADRVGIMVVVNDRTTASTFTTQINGAAGNVSITVPAGQTGWFEDAVNSDTLAAGNEYKGVFVAGTGGTNLRVASVRYRWTPTGAAGITLYNDGTSIPASGAHFTGIGGTLGALGSSEASVQQPVAAGTLRRLQIQMRSNTSGLASTVTLRVNGVDTAVVVTIPANQTGLFEDAVNSVVVADGDLASLRWDVQTGGATWRTFRHQITHDATDALSALGSWGNGNTVPAGASRYGPPNLLLFDNNGHVLSSPLYRARVATPTTVEQCWLWVTANAATTDSFYRLLKNQVSVASVTIPAGQTGAFSFLPGTAFADGDDIGWEITAGTGGDLTVSANAFRLAPASAGGALTAIHTESASLAESPLKALGIRRLRGESVSLLEGVTRVMALVRLQSGTVQLGESVLRSLGIVRGHGESLSLVTGRLSVLGLVRARSDTVDLPESPSSVRGLVRMRSETADLAEGRLSLRGITRMVGDVVSLGSAVLSRLGLVRAQTDSASLSEAVARLLGIRRIQGEVASLAEAPLRTLALTRQRGETVQVLETTLRRMAITRTQGDTVDLIEVLVRRLVLIRVRGETIEMAEAVLPLRGLVVIRGETVELTEGTLGLVAVAFAGFLLAALTLVPALGARLGITPSLPGDPSVSPSLGGRPTIDPET